MSEAEVKLEAPDQTDPMVAERTRLATLLFQKSIDMTNDYKRVISHTGSLVSASMVFAYSKAFNDCIKLILKENQDVKEK
jgi:hypothetical protein